MNLRYLKEYIPLLILYALVLLFLQHSIKYYFSFFPSLELMESMLKDKYFYVSTHLISIY